MAKPLATAVLLLLSAFASAEAENQTDVISDFLVQLEFSINNTRLPDYLLNITFNHASESNITTADILNLYSTNEIDLTTTKSILKQLNVNESNLFSIAGLNYSLELFNLTFQQFYNDFLNEHNLTGTLAIKNALEALQINAAEFSMGMQYGSPDPWTEFIKGNFSIENLENACSILNITLEITWSTVKQLFTRKIVLYDVDKFLTLLKTHGIAETEALIIWNETAITNDQVYNVTVFGDLINTVLSRVNNQTVLGAIIGPQEIVIHRNIYDTFSPDRTVLSIKAANVLNGNFTDIGSINDTTYRNLVVLQPNSSVVLRAVEIIEDSQQDVTNCSYVTLLNNSVITSYDVPLATYKNYSYIISDLVNDTVISGSALLCNNTLYGLARGIEEGAIVIDGFATYRPDPQENNGSNLIGSKWALVYNTILTSLIVMIISH